MKFFKSLVAAGLLAGMAAAPMVAQAGLIALRLSDGATTVTIVDGGVGDMNGAAGVITFIGGIGAFSINVSTVIGDSATTFPGVHFDSINNSFGAGNLQVSITETGLALGGDGDLLLQSAFGGIAGGSIRGRVYLDDNNAAFGTSELMFDSGVLGSGAFASSGYHVTGATDPFSMTMLVDISHRQGATTSFNFETRVPEPATLSLMGLGLLGLGVASRRRRKSVAAG